MTIKTEHILASLGVPLDKADDFLIHLIESMIRQCREIATPCVSATVFDLLLFNPKNHSLKVNDERFLLGKMVFSALQKSSSIVVFIGTCGEQVELLSKRHMKDGNTLEGYIVDLIGSEIAEGVAEYIHQKLTDTAAKGQLYTTNRYSPGYCNWPVSEQQVLFRLMGDKCGVKLTASSLMMPIKSVSGIIGVGKFVENRGYACDRCNTDLCLYRDKNKT